MSGRVLLCAALGCGLAGASVAMAADAPAAHRYVNIGAAVLPGPGDPTAVIFADVGAASKAGGSVAMDVLYAFGSPQSIGGVQTAYVVFQYEVACDAKTVRTPRVTSYAPGGASQVTESTDPARPAEANDAPVVTLACASAPAAGGYSTVTDVLTHAANFVRTQREQDAKLKHHFVHTGAANGGRFGAFDLFVDTATMERSGDQVTAQSLEVFQRAIDPAAQPGAYAINTVTVACAAKTETASFVVLYQVDGTPLQSGLTGARPKAVTPGTMDEKLMKLVCDNTDPVFGPPHSTLSETLISAWRSLASRNRG